ncbi:type VII secretion system-associated protein [Lentzea alba]|uniref:type VII secretion system-associated protein n=1 Tax=Lentzea alba TaxID=2714351 RepID=UPI0039BF5E4B
MTAADDDRSGNQQADQPADDDQWVFLIDPAWQAAEPVADTSDEVAEQADGEVEGPPLEAVIGGWLVTANGTVGRFRANPDYRPSQPGSPTDPVDATIQLLMRGEADSDALFAVIRESVFDVALDEGGRPVIAPSPDDVPSLLVSTAPAQRFRVNTDNWRGELTAAELSDLAQEHGVDVLFNPGGPASIRLIGDVFTENVKE